MLFAGHCATSISSSHLSLLLVHHIITTSYRLDRSILLQFKCCLLSNTVRIKFFLNSVLPFKILVSDWSNIFFNRLFISCIYFSCSNFWCPLFKCTKINLASIIVQSLSMTLNSMEQFPYLTNQSCQHRWQGWCNWKHGTVLE